MSNFTSSSSTRAGDGYSDLILPSILPFKVSQIDQRFPKAAGRTGRHWRHLRQILQHEGYQNLPLDEPTYVSIESPPSTYPAKKYCDITGYEAPYTDPHTKLRYADVDTFKRLRALPDEFIQGFLEIRGAKVVLK